MSDDLQQSRSILSVQNQRNSPTMETIKESIRNSKGKLLTHYITNRLLKIKQGYHV